MGAPTPLPVAHLFGLADLWLEDEVKPHKKSGTYRTYESVVRVHIKPFFGDEPIASLTVRDVDRFTAELNRKGLSPQRINAILTALSSMCATAVRWGYLHETPCQGIKWARVTNPEEYVWFDGVQQAAFLDACERHCPEIWRLFFLGFTTGARPGEAVAAQEGDLDLVRGSIHIQRTITKQGGINLPKGNKTRRVPLSRATVATLRATRHLNGELVCPAPGGELWTESALRYRWDRACKAAGLPFCGPHTMRHSYASQLVSRGASLYAVQELLGHTTPRQTQRYAHLAPDAKRATVQLLDQAPPTDAGHNLDTA